MSLLLTALSVNLYFKSLLLFQFLLDKVCYFLHKKPANIGTLSQSWSFRTLPGIPDFFETLLLFHNLMNHSEFFTRERCRFVIKACFRCSGSIALKLCMVVCHIKKGFLHMTVNFFFKIPSVLLNVEYFLLSISQFTITTLTVSMFPLLLLYNHVFYIQQNLLN